jgi:hypothetical protein
VLSVKDTRSPELGKKLLQGVQKEKPPDELRVPLVAAAAEATDIAAKLPPGAADIELAESDSGRLYVHILHSAGEAVMMEVSASRLAAASATFAPSS